MDDTDELLSIRAAELYYEDGKTQEEIGSLLHLTRWKVGRLLARARELGFIRIEIVHPRARRLSAERMLRERFGLKDAVVVQSEHRSDEDVHDRVAQAAADYLAGLRPVPRTLGVSWGRTLQSVSDKLREGWANGVDVVQINGGVSLNTRDESAAATAVRIAQNAGGSATLLPSPAILQHVDTKLAIEGDRSVASVLDLARNAAAYLFSAGVADSSSVLVDSGYLTASDVEELVKNGAVGDVVGRYIDASGEIVDRALNDRTVGLELDELRLAPHSIAVIAGPSKLAIARAVVTSGICTVLITDEVTSAALLADDNASDSLVNAIANPDYLLTE